MNEHEAPDAWWRPEQHARPLPPGAWRYLAAVAGAVALAVLVATGWLWRAWIWGLDWSRENQANAAAVQAVAALGALLATVVLLYVTWRQGETARKQTERQIQQATLTTNHAAEERRLAEEATVDARRDAEYARTAAILQAERAVRPIVAWANPIHSIEEVYDTPFNVVTITAVNVGVGPAVLARFWVGNGFAPKPTTGLGYVTLRPFEEQVLSLTLFPQTSDDPDDLLIKPDRPADVRGSFVAQFFAAYRDVYGHRFGSRVDVYELVQPYRFVLGPLVDLPIPDAESTIPALRVAELPAPT